jgi:hypothetical protein
MHQLLNLTLDGGYWSDSRPSHFIPPLSLCLARTHTHKLNGMPGGPQSLSGRLGGEKKYSVPARNRTTVPRLSSLYTNHQNKTKQQSF